MAGSNQYKEKESDRYIAESMAQYFSDENYDDLAWRDVENFNIYGLPDDEVKKRVQEWQYDGRCMLFERDKERQMDRYLVRSNSDYYNLLVDSANGWGWQISNGVRPKRLGLYISGIPFHEMK